MSLISALYTGVSGLQTYGDSLQTIGDNIANVNTTAFKSSRAEFADVLNQSINVASGNSQIGRGVTLSRITSDFAQGSFSNTDRLTDLAINGNGFFVVNDGNQNFYTRNGQFSINKSGNLVTSAGLALQGYAYTNGVQSQTLSTVNVSAATSAPQMTGTGATAGSGVNISANLNAGDPVIAGGFDPTNPSTTSNLSTSVTVYDSLGASHVLNVYFNKLAAPSAGVTGATASWEWHVGADGAAPSATANGTLDFNASGNMINIPTTPTTAAFNFVAGTPQTIGFNFAGNGGSQLPTTQWASASAIESQSQDGYGSGNLTSIAVGEDGVVTGTFSNGRNAAISQVALANVPNLQGLHRDGNGLYSETTDSGGVKVFAPTLGGTGTIASYSLELSNVDLANEFVNLISTQRAYQANSKVITTGDQLLQEIVNIIR